MGYITKTKAKRIWDGLNDEQRGVLVFVARSANPVMLYGENRSVAQSMLQAALLVSHGEHGYGGEKFGVNGIHLDVIPPEMLRKR